MKRLLLTVFALLAWLPLVAYEVHLVPVLQVNIRDQVEHVLPKYGISVTSRVDRVERFQPFQIEIPLIIEERLAHPLKLRGSLTVIDPDGKRSVGFEDTELFELPAGSQGVFFPKIYVVSHFSGSDKPGMYRAELTYSDGSQEKSVAFQIELVEDISDLSDMNEAEFDQLVKNYYFNPKPQRLKIALTTYIDYIEPGLIRREGGRDKIHPMATYKWFIEVFKLNPQFHDDLAALSKAVRPEDRRLMAIIFAGLGDEVIAEYENDIQPDVLQLARDPRTRALVTFDQVALPNHLDMLMAEFLATGRFAPVLTAVGELRQRPTMSVEEARERGGWNQLSESDRQLVMNGILEQCTLWMLRSNIQQGHTLLAYYLETILQRRQYADRHAAEQIIVILTSKD